MLIPVLLVLLGLVGLLWSADRFVGAAAATACRAGMSTMLVGMTIVSIGTSAPEIVVSIMASLDGAPNLATGNAWLKHRQYRSGAGRYRHGRADPRTLFHRAQGVAAAAWRHGTGRLCPGQQPA